ncbi:hypothetical protein SAMN05216554_3978 [Herbiconiux ginsengi]|uniref:Peptidase inhibitor family I36 n=1 Tax=Herbiconiux ginsengi TaxID=381665 RepID=A0A1H3T582_9MICO|nr:hypothetical protein SAMN05216554_3978 [Herbiconiux ginsengi]
MRRLAALGLAAAAALTILTATSASASASASPTEPAQSCWTNVDTGQTGCFDAALDPVEAIELATGRPLVTGESASRSAAPTGALVDYLLLTGYDGQNMTGLSNSYFSSNANICNAVAYGFQNLGTWSDRFESFQSSNGCQATFYADTLYDGTAYGPFVSKTTMGSFNNVASSVYID